MSRTEVDPLVPYGRALRDWFAGDRDATLLLRSSLGEREEIPVSVFFREPDAFFPFEEAALALARGRVLDLGAGTGVHAVPLQERGFEVTAVEIVPEAAEILRGRGVRRVLRGDMRTLDAGAFDTVLMLMNGIGPVGTLAGLSRFLEEAPRMLAPGGQLLVDSGEAILPDEPEEPSAREPLEWPAATADAYPGEAWIRLEYGGRVGRPFRELYVDAETFAARARAAGWAVQLAYEDAGGSFLARLSRDG